MKTKKDKIEVVVGALVFNKKGEILLVEGDKWKNMYSIPGGKVEFGESFHQALKREMYEEIGVYPRDTEFLRVNESIFSSQFHRQAHFVFLNFVCSISKEESIECCKREINRYIWVDPKRALRELRLKKSVREVIEFYLKKDDL